MNDDQTAEVLAEAGEYLAEEEARQKEILTAEEILNAPSDLVDEILDVPEWGGKIKIRSLTAAASAKVKQASIDLAGKSIDVVWAAMEKAQFELGVVEPKFSKEQVNVLHHKFGPSFKRVTDALDRISGTNKEELRQAHEAFPVAED